MKNIKMIEPEFIFSRGDYLFFDTSALCNDWDNLRNMIRAFRSYEQLNKEVLDFQAEKCKALVDQLYECEGNEIERGTPLFIPKVIGEFKEFHSVLQFHFKKFEKHKPRRIDDKNEQNRRAYRTVETWYKNLLQFAKDHSFPNPNTEQFNQLNRTLVQLATIMKLKNKSYLSEDENRTALIRDNKKTDEEIIASSLYLSAERDVGCGVITGDGDLEKILRAGLAYFMESGKFSEILQAVERNPVWVYNCSSNPPFYLESTEIIKNERAYEEKLKRTGYEHGRSFVQRIRKERILEKINP